MAVGKSLIATFALAGVQGGLASRSILQDIETVGLPTCKVPPSFAEEFVMMLRSWTSCRCPLTRASLSPSFSIAGTPNASSAPFSRRGPRTRTCGRHETNASRASTHPTSLPTMMNLVQVWSVHDHPSGEDRTVS